MFQGRMPLLVASVLALIAGGLTFVSLQNSKQKAQAGWNLVPILVAKTDIKEGKVLSEELIEEKEIPEKFVTHSFLRPNSRKELITATVLVDLQKGDPFLFSHFAAGKVKRLSEGIPVRMRAVTIAVSKSTAVGGWVRPDDRVDIVGTFRDPTTNERFSATVLQNVIVLATGKVAGSTNANFISDSQKDYTNVSLLVNPEDAEMLVLAADAGQLSISLRHKDDLEKLDTARSTLKTILSGERKFDKKSGSAVPGLAPKTP